MNHTTQITQYKSRITSHISRFLALVCVMSLLLGLASPALAQDDITFTASVNRNTISTDETLTLQLTLAGAFSGANQPQLPPLEGFAVVGTSQSSQFSIVNGKTTSQVVFTYRLQPTQIGTLTIPAIPVQMGGRTYQTDPVTIEVTQGAAPQAQQPAPETPADTTAPGELAGQDLYVEADVDNSTPVVGQQIIYYFRFYQAVNLFNQPQLNWPEFTGFIGYDLSPNNQYYQQVAGREYLVTEVRRALFATTQGEVAIGPATLSVPGDFFNRGIEMPTNAVAVDVRPLPVDAPEGFAGAVGQFEIEAWTEPTESRVNEPVTLYVRVSGVGNVSALPDPTEGAEDVLPGWRVYDPQITTDVGQEGDGIQGTKLFERPLVPKTDGALTIPPFSLAFFDPAQGAYRHVETAPQVVQVAPGETQDSGPVVISAGNGKQEVIVLASDIRHIKPAPPALVTDRTSPLSQPLYWAGWAMPLLAVVGTWLWDRRRHHLAHNVAYARAQRARSQARKRLVEARKLLESDQDAAYAAVARAITAYLGDKFNLPAAGLTRDAIQQTLSASSVLEDQVDRLLTCLDWADSGRFAPVAAGRDVNDLIQEAEKVITQLEEGIT
ncbi:MAG: protein BatD [Chloroflexi bacterium]|nr:protein BatD [Chloroflexota bacterium]